MGRGFHGSAGGFFNIKQDFQKSSRYSMFDLGGFRWQASCSVASSMVLHMF